MNTSSLFNKKNQNHKNGKYLILQKLVTLFLCLLGVLIFIRLFFVSDTSRFRVTPQDLESDKNLRLQHQSGEKCEVFKGQWTTHENRSSYNYTSKSCSWIPDWKNCFKHGRKDTEFVNWRWKPDGCELARFNPNIFLRIVQNKRMLFLGDSVARNHMESLLCLLSQVVSPTDLEDDPGDNFRTLYFSSHNFTIYFLRSTFLVVNEEIMENNSSTGSFNIHINKVDKTWAKKLPGMDYAIISDAHWFFRKNYLYEHGKLIGCVHCTDLNVKDLGLAFAIRKVFETSLNFINGCKSCKRLLTLLRTFSPAHFENGTWNTGGYCNRTSPVTEGEVNMGGVEWEIRTVQVEEIERARRKGEQRGQRFEVLDVTKAMLMRPDGHPNSHWGNQWNKGINDCLHWCLPGPIDMWNDLLLAVLKKEIVSPL